jgi:hypothetical protein
MFLGSRGRPMRRSDNITAMCEPIVYTTNEPDSLPASQCVDSSSVLKREFCGSCTTTFILYRLVFLPSCLTKGRGRAVGIATGCGLDVRGGGGGAGVRVPVGSKIFISP